MYEDFIHLADDDGVILRQDVLAFGGDDRTISRALRHGQIVRVRNGAYALRSIWETYDVHKRHLVTVRVAYGASKTAVAVSHTSALALLGGPTWEIPLEDVHLTRLDGRAGRREAGVVQHRGALDREDLTIVNGLCVTSATRTALDMTTLVDMEHSVPVLDHFLHAKQTTKAALRHGADHMRFWANTLGTGMAITFADGRRESVAESRTALLLRGSGRPMPEPQYVILDASGRVVARVDFAWPELGVFLEFDGKIKYTKYLKEGQSVVDAVLAEKKREARLCGLTQWRCIRLTWADLSRPATTRDYIVSVLDGGPVYV